jgi:urease accessory protein
MRIECFEKIDHEHVYKCIDILCLEFADRARSRGKGVSQNGIEISWFLKRGESLKHGDVLKDTKKNCYLVEAKPERMSVVTANSVQLLMKVAYHLGNRHLSVELLSDRLVYQPDHVLDDMVSGLGAQITHEVVAFQPENGAYHSHGHE